jgi:hypothetical protein
MATISSRVASLFDSTINNVLMKSAETIANDARANAPTARIKANIKISPVVDTPEGKQIKISVALDDAPEARAYELGSGIHGEFGTTYPINAKNVPNLVFFWQKKQKWFVGPHVDHPGVAAKPYLTPAVDRNKSSLLGLLSTGLGKVIRAAIITGFEEKTK